MTQRLLAVVLAAGLLSGCSTPVSGGSLIIASYLPVTGPDLIYTQPILNAIDLAFTEKDYKVCEGRWTLQHQVFDDGSGAADGFNPEAAETIARAFTADRTVAAVLGVYNIDTARIVIPILNSARMPVISPSIRDAGLTQPPPHSENEPEDIYYPTGTRNLVRIIPTDFAEGNAGARWAVTLDTQSVFVLDDGSSNGINTADGFEQTAGETGLTVLGRETTSPDPELTAASVTMLIDLNPDLIYLAGTDSAQIGLIVKELGKGGYNGELMVAVGAYSQSFTEAGGDGLETVYLTSTNLWPGQTSEAASQWEENYRSVYGAPAGALAAYGYTAATLLVDAFERVCADGGTPDDRDAVRAAIFATNNFNSILGNLSIETSGDTHPISFSGLAARGDTLEFVTLLSDN